MSKSKMYHLIILDRSGSMSNKISATVEGFNLQLDGIKSDIEKNSDQEHVISLIDFGDDVNVSIWKKSVDDIKPMTDTSFKDMISGCTALWDAIGTGANSLRNEIVEDLSDENTKVFVTIFTDGLNNASKTFSAKDCSGLIKEMKSTDQWAFALVGCDDSIFDVADQLNISRKSTLRVDNNQQGVRMAFGSLSAARTRMSAQSGEGFSRSIDSVFGEEE